MRAVRLATSLAVFLALFGCSETAGPLADAGPLPEPVVDVTQRGRFWLSAEGQAVGRVELAAEGPFELPPAEPAMWGAAYFEHDRYGCTRDGQHTALVLNPPGLPWETPSDVLVYLHGGGVGAFDAGGSYAPAALSQRDCRSMVDQEDPERLLARWSGESCSVDWPPVNGLAEAVVRAADLRVVLVSKCDQDMYSGVGLPDVRNEARPDNRVDGLLAVRAAIELAFREGWTDADHALLLAGASAGGVGVHTVARVLGEEGRRRVAGVISDAAVLNNAIFDRIHAEAPRGCAFFDQVAAPADWRARIGPEVQVEREPSRTIGPDTYPVFQLWAPEDGTFCSPEAARLLFAPTVEAIDRENPGGVSASRAVCVDGDCNAHALLRWVPPGARNTRGCAGAACPLIQDEIIAWLEARRGR